MKTIKRENKKNDGSMGKCKDTWELLQCENCYYNYSTGEIGYGDDIRDWSDRKQGMSEILDCEIDGDYIDLFLD